MRRDTGPHAGAHGGNASEEQNPVIAKTDHTSHRFRMLASMMPMMPSPNSNP